MWIIRMFINHFVYGFIRKAMRLILPVGLLLLLMTSKSYANTSSETYANYVLSATNWVNSANLLGAPDSNYSTLTNNIATLQLTFPSLAIPTGSTITSLTVKFYENSSGNSGGTQKLNVTENTGFVCGTPQPTVNFANGTQTTVVTSSNCQNYSSRVTVTGLNSGTYVVWVQNDGNKTASWDAVSLQATYNPPLPSVGISGLAIATNSATMSFNLSGDTTYTSSTEKCTINLNEQEVGTNNLLAGNFATIKLDAANPRTSTYYEGNGIYDGYGYTSNVSTWSANSISAPYFAGRNTQISQYIKCWHYDSSGFTIYDIQNQSLSPTLTNWGGGGGISTPSGLQSTTPYVQPACTTTDWVCSIVQNFQNTIISTFGFQSDYAADQINYVRGQISTKVPFAYVFAVTNLDFSTATLSSGLTITLPVKVPTASNAGNGIPDNISVTLPSVITDGLNILRNFFIVALWVMFTGYVLVRSRSIFP